MGSQSTSGHGGYVGLDSMTTTSAVEEGFVWRTCSKKEIHERVPIMQQAVDDALRHGLEICQDLRTSDDNRVAASRENFSVRCGRELMGWMEEMDKLQQVSQEFEVLVGVAGRTGAGKTTILNMLLETPELLPSSNSEAATSTVCRIAWNNDDDPDRRFKAEIAFRSSQDVEQELVRLFATMAQRDQGNDSDMDDEGAVFNRMEEEAEMENEISEGLEKIKAIWGLDEEALSDMSARDILTSNREVLELLGTTKTISSGNPEHFAQSVKSYLDSSETAQGFKAWPLITEARLFVKAPLLKHGIVLVDLPGLSDAVESRAQVTEKYRQKLGITAIVTPARRAIDEKTGVQLMSEYQTLRMQLDGAYHKKGFCVVVSQIDEIDCDVFIKGHRHAKEDPELQNDTGQIDILTQRLVTIGAQLNESNTRLEKIAAKFAKVCRKLEAVTPTGPGSQKLKRERLFLERAEKARHEKKEIKRDHVNQKRAIAKLQTAKAVTEAELASLRARQKWQCVSMRNHHITQAIKRDFAQRQKTLARGIPHDPLYDGALDVLHVSATAYRDHLKGREPTGFRTKSNTGIPRLRQWLEDSVLKRREEHLGSLLITLQRLFHNINSWASNNLGHQAIAFPREAIQEWLTRAQTKLGADLEAELKKGSNEVKKLDPFSQIGDGGSACIRVACKAVTRWAVKSPENKKSAALMHWTTFNAIIKRNGGPYRSKGACKAEYNFPEDLAVALLAQVLIGWHKAFQGEIPFAAGRIMQAIGRIWFQYLAEMGTHIKKIAPDILPHFQNILGTLKRIRDEMGHRVCSTLNRLSASSAEIHPEFLSSLRQELEPIFKSCLEITGQGHFKERRAHLYTTVKAHSEEMFTEGCQRMQRKYLAKVAELPRAFEEAAAFAVDRVAGQISLLMDNLEGTRGGDWAVQGYMQAAMQMRLRTRIAGWQMDWEMPKMEVREGVEGVEMEREEGKVESEEGKVKEEEEGEEEDARVKMDVEKGG